MTQLAVEFHPEAVIEARAARQWYASKSADAAAALLAEIDAGITSIQAAAELYPAYLHGTRRYLMRRFPYLIVTDAPRRRFRSLRWLTEDVGRAIGKHGRPGRIKVSQAIVILPV